MHSPPRDKASTFFVYVDIDDTDVDIGGADDYPMLSDALAAYVEAEDNVNLGIIVNARLVASVASIPDQRYEVTLCEIGDFNDPEPDPDNEKAHRDWRIRQGGDDCR